MKLKAILAACIVAILASCNKNHYDLDHLNGVALNGELCVPVASSRYTMGDLMERFHLDTVLVFSEAGDMSFRFGYEVDDALVGSDLLRFEEINEHFSDSIENTHPYVLPQPVDTVVHCEFEYSLVSEHVSLSWAAIKSGLIEFGVESNVTHLHAIEVTVPELTDASGNVLHVSYDPQFNANQVDLAGYYYQAATENILHVSLDIAFAMQTMAEPYYIVDGGVRVSNLAVSEMRGHMGTYTSRNQIDTTFSLFPNNMTGEATFLDARIALQERNTFGLDAELIVDTALVGGNGVEPYSVFAEMPLMVGLPASSSFVESFDQRVDGRLNVQCGEAYASSLFVLNPDGYDGEVHISDTSSLDVKIGVDIPFSFIVDHVTYVDTVNMRLNEIESPEMIQQMVMSLVFDSGLPLNVAVRAYMYDSNEGVVTDALLDDEACIKGMVDGHHTTSIVDIPLTHERLENVFRSDKILLHFDMDTDAQGVTLNLNQDLGVTVRARIQYDGVVDLSNDD